MASGNCVALLYFKQGCVSRRFSQPLISACFSLFLSLFSASGLHAQDVSGTGASGTDAAIRYCADHPSDTSKCITPDKDKPAIPLPSPDVHQLPMVPASKAVNACPGCSTSDAPEVDLPAPVPVNAQADPDWNRINEQIQEQNAADASQQAAEDSNTQDAARQRAAQNAAAQQQQQQNYQAGYAEGQAAGGVLVFLIERHRINSYCKKNPKGGWQFADGTTTTCQAWLARHSK
jgi:hypothetical protein